MIDYLKNQEIQLMFEISGKEIAKKAVTLGSSRVDENSIVEENNLITYVKSEEGELIEETRNKLNDDVVIARNPEPIGEKNGKTIYNEWLVPKETWLKNYGENPTEEFKPYKKKGNIQALEIDQEVLDILGSVDGKTAKIAVDWSDDGMTVYKGGVITDQGYGIAPDELKSTYEEVNNKEVKVDSPKNNSSKLKFN